MDCILRMYNQVQSRLLQLSSQCALNFVSNVTGIEFRNPNSNEHMKKDYHRK
jgi:hypothetical protein